MFAWSQLLKPKSIWRIAIQHLSSIHTSDERQHNKYPGYFNKHVRLILKWSKPISLSYRSFIEWPNVGRPGVKQHYQSQPGDARSKWKHIIKKVLWATKLQFISFHFISRNSYAAAAIMFNDCPMARRYHWSWPETYPITEAAPDSLASSMGQPIYQSISPVAVRKCRRMFVSMNDGPETECIHINTIEEEVSSL